MELEKLKLFARIDHDYEDGLVAALQKAAIQYAERTTGKEYNEESEIWNLLIGQLVAHWYENRTPVTLGGNPVVLPYALKCLFFHISEASDLT